MGCNCNSLPFLFWTILKKNCDSGSGGLHMLCEVCILHNGRLNWICHLIQRNRELCILKIWVFYYPHISHVPKIGLLSLTTWKPNWIWSLYSDHFDIEGNLTSRRRRSCKIVLLFCETAVSWCFHFCKECSSQAVWRSFCVSILFRIQSCPVIHLVTISNF